MKESPADASEQGLGSESKKNLQALPVSGRIGQGGGDGAAGGGGDGAASGMHSPQECWHAMDM